MRIKNITFMIMILSRKGGKGMESGSRGEISPAGKSVRGFYRGSLGLH